MSKAGFFYTLIALIPIIIVLILLYRSFTNKDIDSPVIFSNITNTMDNILSDEPNTDNSVSEFKTKALKVGSTDDGKGMGYTGQDKIAINSKGEAFIVYRAKGEGDFEIFVSKIKNGKLISNGAVTDSDDTTQRVPSIAIDHNDVIHITWYGLTSNNAEGRQVKYIRSTDDGQTWTEPKIPSLVGGYVDDDYWQEHPQILTDNNNLYIVWEGKDSNHQEQQAKFMKSTDGGNSWSQWKNIQANPDNTQSRPYLILDSNNNLNVFIYSSRESDFQQIWHSVSKDRGETWSDWQKVSEGLDDSRHASATLFGDKILVAWRSESDDKSQLYYSILNGNNWSKPEKVLQSDSYQFFPVVGVNNNNEVGIVWVENETESEFPRDDPEDSKGYFAKLNLSENKFENKTLIGENIYYPHIPVRNLFDNKFYIAYGQGENREFDIKLLTTN